MSNTSSPFLDRLSSTAEGRRKLNRERLILQITEMICEIMAEDGIKRSELAARMHCSPSEVTQFLDGTQNMTLARLADIFAALGRDFIPRACRQFSPADPVTITTYKIESSWKSVAPTTVTAEWTDYKPSDIQPLLRHVVRASCQLVDSL